MNIHDISLFFPEILFKELGLRVSSLSAQKSKIALKIYKNISTNCSGISY